MEKEITIKPANKDFRIKVQALGLLNQFAALGFDSRAAFMAIVTYYYPKYKEGKETNRLSNWWYSKYTDVDMNTEMEIVLNKLKHE